ncbi:DNA cytosine methyltransferase [Lactiplantibacillus plantarum]|nr:DNA cytosine methyltransferase [Lactiplantibacillus plantarum]WHQ52364.1 DNA cytosine methyltransferase [Lactiplantibacillus plantarum]WHQ66630.1 DNA cytosine methyltransferase [Lactiplantibacillus plantarum]
MQFIDMFAGIGGFHLGMEQAGHTCVGWIEWDKFARQSYQAIHDVEGIWNASDIRTVRASELPRADCWCFGFPCQDISVAGKQKGFTAGKRSSLFFTVTGLIRDLEEEDRPSYLLIENVKNLLSINRGFDFLKLQIELDEIGYDVEWDVLDSAEVVPQHRERIFIVGHLRGRRTQQVFPIVQDDREVNRWADATNTLTTRYGEAQGSGSYVAESESPKVKQAGNLNDFRIRKLTPLECWRLQGFPDWAFNRARQAGLSDSQLYKQAGNSVTVPVIKAIAEKMELP